MVPIVLFVVALFGCASRVSPSSKSWLLERASRLQAACIGVCVTAWCFLLYWYGSNLLKMRCSLFCSICWPVGQAGPRILSNTAVMPMESRDQNDSLRSVRCEVSVRTPSSPIVSRRNASEESKVLAFRVSNTASSSSRRSNFSVGNVPPGHLLAGTFSTSQVLYGCDLPSCSLMRVPLMTFCPCRMLSSHVMQ